MFIFFTIQRYGIQSIAKYNHLQTNTLDWKGNDSSITAEELFHKVTYSVEEDIKRVPMEISAILINKTVNFCNNVFTPHCI